MTTVTDREQLIARVRAIRDDAYLSATYLADEHVGDLMGEILAVFEQAHSPTDDEREALAEVLDGVDIIREKGETRRYALRQADAALAAGFRRTVQGEPTLCLVEHPITGRRCSQPAEPSHAHVCDLPPEPKEGR